MWPFEKKYNLLDSGLLQGAVDRHSHILYAVDDGVKAVEESLEILDYLSERGVSQLWFTPHVMEDVPNTTERLTGRFEQLKSAYQGPVELHLAAEYMMDSLLMKRIADRDLLTMENNMVLFETSAWRAPEGWRNMFTKAKEAGYRPIFAHVERYVYLDMPDYDELYRSGIMMQLNYASLTGYYGTPVQKKARALLEKGYYSFCGSDCHRFDVLRQQYTAKVLTRKDISRISRIFR